MGKKLSSNTLSTQLSTVLSNFIFSFFLILATLYETSVQFRIKVIGADVSYVILYFVLYRNNQIYKKGQSQRLKWLGQHNNNRGLLKEQTGLTNLQAGNTGRSGGAIC